MATIILKGKPKSTGSIYRHMCMGKSPRVYMTTDGKALKEDYQWQAKAQWQKKPLTGPLTVVISTYHDTHRKNDWDNFHKLSMDALSGIVYDDDSQIEKAVVHKCYDKNDPRIEIEVLPHGESTPWSTKFNSHVRA